MSKNLLLSKISLLFKRLERLLIPYIIWPIIFFIINILLSNKYMDKYPYNFEILKLQLLYGHMHVAQFWFLWNLIVITVIFHIIIFIFGKKSLFVLHLLLILSYKLQYSNYIAKYFSKFPRYNRFTFTRIFGMFPLAVTGFSFGFYKIINFIKNNQIKTLIFSFIIYNMINDYNIFTNQPIYYYYGINLNIKAICIIYPI